MSGNFFTSDSSIKALKLPRPEKKEKSSLLRRLLPRGRRAAAVHGGVGACAWVGLRVASAARAQSCPSAPKRLRYKQLRVRTKQTQVLTVPCHWRATPACSERAVASWAAERHAGGKTQDGNRWLLKVVARDRDSDFD